MNRGASLTTGLVMLVVGIVFCLFPYRVLSMFSIMAGIALLLVSVSCFLACAGTLRGTPIGTVTLIVGIVGVLCACACLFHPSATASTITWLAALCVVIFGILQLISLVLASGMPGQKAACFAAVLVIIFGICAMLRPGMVVEFMGVALIAESISTLLVAFASSSR